MKVLIACEESQKAQKPYISRHSKSYGGAMGRKSK